MAIAFNAAADLGNNGGSGNLTTSYTVSAGSNRLLVVAVAGDTTTDNLGGVTYNSVSMSLACKQGPAGGSNRWTYLFYLFGPASGANNVVVSAGSANFVIAVAADYTGVPGPNVDATVTNGPGGSISSLTTSITTVADNCWAILAADQPSSAVDPVQGTGLTIRQAEQAFHTLALFDSNGVIHPAGSYSMTTSDAAGAVNTIIHAAASFSPTANSSSCTPTGTLLGVERCLLLAPLAWTIRRRNKLAGKK